MAFDNEGGNYSIMTAHLYFRRRTLFFSFNFIIPCLIITICSIFGFMLPPESGEKIGLRKQKYLISFIYFLLYLNELFFQFRNNKFTFSCLFYSICIHNYTAKFNGNYKIE